MSEEIEWMTYSEAAKYLRISIPTLYRRIKDGTLPRYKIGSKGLMDKKDVDFAVKRVDAE